MAAIVLVEKYLLYSMSKWQTFDFSACLISLAGLMKVWTCTDLCLMAIPKRRNWSSGRSWLCFRSRIEPKLQLLLLLFPEPIKKHQWSVLHNGLIWGTLVEVYWNRQTLAGTWQPVYGHLYSHPFTVCFNRNLNPKHLSLLCMGLKSWIPFCIAQRLRAQDLC